MLADSVLLTVRDPFGRSEYTENNRDFIDLFKFLPPIIEFYNYLDDIIARACARAYNQLRKIVTKFVVG